MITAENLTKSVNTANVRGALHEVSLEIPAGALFGLYGPTGAGKSTLARLIALRERPDAGALRVEGVSTGRLNDRSYRELRSRFQTVDPDYLLLPERTAAGNVAAPLERIGVEGPQRRHKVAELLDLVGLTRAAAVLPGDLCEGQRRRVAIARALVLNPSLLVVDEPTAGLDAEQAAGVLAALDRTRAELGVTVVLATSDADVVRKVCDHVAVLDAGQIVETGALLELLADQDSHTARALLPEVDERGWFGDFDQVADVVLVGYATVNSLIPTAAERLGVEISTLGGDTTRIGDTPIARFRVGVRGERADFALSWLSEHGAQVSRVRRAARVLVAA